MKRDHNTTLSPNTKVSTEKKKKIHTYNQHQGHTAGDPSDKGY